MPRLLAVPHTISNKYDVFRMLSPKQKLRAIVVLIFALTLGVLLLNFPGPLFHEVAKAPRFSPEWTETLPMAADEQTVILRQRAAAALDAIRARKNNER
jgi:hypothetical protein